MSGELEFMDCQQPTLVENLALDEALLLDAEEGAAGEVLRVWRWPEYAVVLGAGGVIADDVHEHACTTDGVPIHRRSSGGGTVLLGSGCLLYSLVLDMRRAPELGHVNASYRWILHRVAEALSLDHAPVELSGISDLVVAGRKLSGNAQQRKRRFILHHGTILHGFDLQRVGKYLKLPPRRPDYRGDRPHEQFLINVSSQPEELIASLRRVFNANREGTHDATRRAALLVEEKYGREEFVRRR